jgi:hypothetical protein
MTTLVEWFQALPEHAVIPWGTDSLATSGVLTDWVDVNIPALEAATGSNWAFTISDPFEDIMDGLRYNGGIMSEALRPFTTGLDPKKLTFEPTDKNWSIYLPHTHSVVNGSTAIPADERPDVDLDGNVYCDGWTSDVISAALTARVLEISGRNVIFIFDSEAPLSPMMARIEARLATMTHDDFFGSGITTASGSEVRFSADVMDDLLALDPNEAAKLAARMNAIFGDLEI